MFYLKFLYIFFLILALNLSFFSTKNVNAKAFLIKEIQISEKLENNFNKEILIGKGFDKAFKELIGKLVKSKDFDKTNNANLNEIKSMIETFSIKEEKFVNNTYFLNLGVSFNKKKIFKYLDSKNVFPAQILEEKFLFIPIIIDQLNSDLFVFSNNPIYENWIQIDKKNFLIKFVLPTEDLEDLNLIKENYSELENYDFSKIIEKYFLDYSIIALIFKDNSEIKILSKINIKDKKVIKSNSFKNIDLKNKENLEFFFENLKIIYEDFWKDYNLINTSIKLPLTVQVNNQDLNLSSTFEKTLDEIDLISNYFINRFNQDFVYYEIIFNGTPQNFINIMSEKNYTFDTQKNMDIEMENLNQLIINFDYENFKNEDFYVSNSNRHVFSLIDKWPKWEKNFVNINGEKSSGKTHLINIFIKKFKGIKFDANLITDQDLKKVKIDENIILENLNKDINEKLIYSLFNIIDLDNKYIIVTSEKPILDFDFLLNDLKSRTKNFLLYKIEKPDDELIFALILKNLSDRQISLDKKLIDFIIKRIDRSYGKIFDFIYKVDELSLKKKKRIDFKIIKEVLGE